MALLRSSILRLMAASCALPLRTGAQRRVISALSTRIKSLNVSISSSFEKSLLLLLLLLLLLRQNRDVATDHTHSMPCGHRRTFTANRTNAIASFNVIHRHRRSLLPIQSMNTLLQMQSRSGRTYMLSLWTVRVQQASVLSSDLNSDVICQVYCLGQCSLFQQSL